jgi:bifunctional DNA-binding transcriptional regulator/antitoxin component of YhaV-PrlF toxin-antitoxin module
MYWVRLLGAKGTIVIPNEIWDHFGLMMGSSALNEVNEGRSS